MTDHEPDPHHTPQGEWVCAVKNCGRKLMGTYLRPVIPWKHRPEKAATEETVLPGLGTTE